jgi:hypothetical protein
MQKSTKDFLYKLLTGGIVLISNIISIVDGRSDE